MFAVPSNKNILEAMPEMKNLSSFVSEAIRKDINKVIRFIVAMYDSKSPFVKMFQAVDQRKRECAAFAGFDLKKDEKLLNQMFSFAAPQPVDEDEEQEDFTWYSDMVVEYLRDQNNRVWAMIVSNEQTFYEYQKALLSEVTVFTSEKDKLNAISIKTKLMEDSDAISARLEKYYQLLYGDEIVNSTTVKYTPEGLAKKK